jgi:hypothetical protein
MPSRRTLLIGAALGLLLAAACAFFAFSTLDAFNEFQTQVDRLEAIEQSGDVLIELRGGEAIDEMRRLRGLTIPASASDAYFARQGSAPAYFWLRFTLSSDDADTFFSTCFETPQTGYNPGFEYAHNPDVMANLDWWTPDTATSFAGATCSPQADVRAAALLDQSDPAQWTVYLEIVSE